MARYRIVETHTIDNDNNCYFTIEKLMLFGWRELKIIEQGALTKRIKHATKQDAIDYMKLKYFNGDGLLRIKGDTYTYTEYSYGF